MEIDKGFTNKDWRLKLITDKNLFSFTHNIKFMLTHLLLSMIERNFMEIFYRVEKYFPFEILFNNKTETKLNEIFFDILDNLLEVKNQFNNSDQSNSIKVCFGFKLPF